MRLTVRPTVLLALGALTVGSISLVSAMATPAAADDATTIVSEDFESGSIGALWPSGYGPFGDDDFVPDPSDPENTVLALTDREENYFSVSTAGSGEVLAEGLEHTVSMRVRLIDGDDSSQTISIVDDVSYSSIAGDGASASVTADEWVSLEGTYVPTAANTKVYPEAPTGIDFLVDDFVVTVQPDAGTPEPCEPVVSIDFEDGSYEPWQESGDGVGLTIGDEDGDAVLEVTGRADSYYGIQSPEGVFEAGVPYTFSADVKLTEASKVRFIAYDESAEQDYNWVGDRDVDADEWTTISGTFTFGATHLATAKAYIEVDHVDGNHQDYLIGSIVVTAPCEDGPTPGTIALSTDFEDDLDGWGPRNVSEGDHDVDITTEDAHGGNQSALVSNRVTQGSGIGIDVTTLMEPGTQYEVSAWIKFADGQEPDDVVLSMQRNTGESTTYANLATGENMSNSAWVPLTGTFSSGSAWDTALLYFETAWEGEGIPANTSDFMIDDIEISVPAPAVIQDLQPLHETLDMPVGVAIDSRETSGAPAELLTRHFNQITAENHMKVENWYDADRNFVMHSEARELLDFAVEYELGLFGHVLVWHSQSPDWFFQHDDGTPLTNSEGDKQILRDRLEEHIFNVAESIADDYGRYGSDGNPMVGWDVVNEVVSDQATSDGLRQSELYQVLGEEYIHLAFEYADEAFNNVYAEPGSDRPVLLYINEYNTEQGLKGDQYEALVRRMLDEGTPLDGVGHQFHLSVNASVTAMRATLDRYVGLGLRQAVTEFDVTINPANEANRVRQGHFYRDAFAMFRDYHYSAPDTEKLSSITIWGLTDNRSWRSDQQPLMFDGNLQAKPAYYGAVADLDNLPGLITTANVFQGEVALASGFEDAIEWRNLPENPLTGGVGAFQTRWNDDHLTVLLRSTVEPELIEFTYEGAEYVYGAAASDSLEGAVTTVGGDTFTVVHVPHTGVARGDNAEFDVRVVSGGDVAGAWNSPGDVGQLTFLEPLSVLESPELPAPDIDGDVDDVWAGVPAVTTGTTVEGSANGAKAQVRTLWDDDTLYVLYEVEDSVIDATNSDPWNKDGVELFLDLGNNKNGTYGPNDTQIRVTIDGDLSFGEGNTALQQSRVLDHAVQITDSGYNVELAIALIGQSGGQSDVPLGGEGVFHGIDFQVNDGREGSRYAVHTWAEPTGTGYQNTDRWGVTQQVDVLSDNGDGGPGEGDTPGNGGPGDGGPGDGDGVITPLPEDELKTHDDGGLDVPASARAGETITIGVGTQHAGTATQTFLYSEPVLIGQSIVDADGNIRVTIPLDTEPGAHTIAVYDTDGNLLGWASIDILAADGSLSATGADGYLLPLSIGLLLMLAGLAMVARRQRAGQMA